MVLFQHCKICINEEISSLLQLDDSGSGSTHYFHKALCWYHCVWGGGAVHWCLVVPLYKHHCVYLKACTLHILCSPIWTHCSLKKYKDKGRSCPPCTGVIWVGSNLFCQNSSADLRFAYDYLEHHDETCMFPVVIQRFPSKVWNIWSSFKISYDDLSCPPLNTLQGYWSSRLLKHILRRTYSMWDVHFQMFHLYSMSVAALVD